MLKIIILGICLFLIGQEASSQQEGVSKWTLRQELLVRNSKYTLDPPNSRTKVNTKAILLSVDKIQEDDMEFTAHFLLTMNWSDYRLVYGDRLERIKKLPVTNPQSIWTPSICFIDDKKDLTFDKAPLNEPITIYPDGKVFYTKRISVTVPCALSKNLSPNRSQKCTIRWKLCDATVDEDVQLIWEQNPVSYRNSIYLFQYNLDKVVTYADPETAQEPLRYMYMSFYLSRPLEYYINKIYGPSTVAFFLSWLQLWLNDRYATARIVLGLTAFMLCALTCFKGNELETSIFSSMAFVITFIILIQSVCILRIEQLEKKAANNENTLKETNGRFMLLKNRMRTLKSVDIDTILKIFHPLVFITFCLGHFSFMFEHPQYTVKNDPAFEFKVNVTETMNIGL